MVPDAPPTKAPVPALIVATVVLLLLHTPPVVGSPKISVAPTQTAVLPMMGNNGFTNIAVVAKQPDGSIYVIVTVPPAIPVTIPVNEPIVAMVLLLLLHVPPDVLSLTVINEPAHTESGPDIGAGTEHGGILACRLPTTAKTEKISKRMRFIFDFTIQIYCIIPS